MSYANGWAPFKVIVLRAEGEPVVEKALPYHHPVARPDEVWHLLHEHPPDAIIATDHCPDHIALFRTLRNTLGLEGPVLVLISDAPQAEYLEYADIILPSQAPALEDYLNAQLQTVLRLRAQNHALNQEKHALEQKIEDLETALIEQKQASDRELSLLKNAIVRNVSHELKTPLLQVKSAVALLAEDVGQTNLIGYATDATSRLEAVVKNITQLASSLETRREQVVLREIIDYVILDLRRIWQRKADISRIRVNIEKNLPLVLADKNGIGTVLQMLLDNALKFSQDTVEVSAARMGDKVRVSVRDYGIGIAKDKIEKIFESFYQVDSSSTRRYGGTGVGLAIVRLILDHHQIPILVESQEGRGSIFSFELPIAELDDQLL
jgi:signal transduction histidine kinase